MRLVPGMCVLLVLCLLGPGCALFKKNGSSGRGDPPPPKFPTGPAGDPIKDGPLQPPPPAQTTAGVVKDQAVLAGRVLDVHSRPPSNAHISWVCLDDSKKPATPAEAEVNADGYFMIPGLKPNTQYKLIAHTKQGEKVLAGMSIAQAPHLTVFIQVKEEFAFLVTPGNGIEKAEGPKDATTKTSAVSPNQPANGWASPGPAGIAAANNAVPVLDTKMNVPSPSGAPASSAVAPPSWSPSGVADNSKPPPLPPALNIPNPGSRPGAMGPSPPANPPRAPALNPSDGKLGYATPRVPSCVVLAGQLQNLALVDTSGGTWEYRTNKRGKLVLFDFWSTACMPCRQLMPELNRLQIQYGNQGLEVIGIAFEEGTREQQVVRVNMVCRGLKVKYRQLLGEPVHSNVKEQFRAATIPKLVLLDETGKIVWNHVGLPERAIMGELESLIQRQLTSRPS
jgi:thiol-disulfide isomerase/thioredoxin